MKTSDRSPEQSWQQMEFDQMSLPVDFPARTSQSPDYDRGSKSTPDQDYGQNCIELLATYDRKLRSWRTSQVCLVAQLNKLADGFAEYSGILPRSGMMQNGIAYPLPPLAPSIAETDSGALPTQTKKSKPRQPEHIKQRQRQESKENAADTVGKRLERRADETGNHCTESTAHTRSVPRKASIARFITTDTERWIKSLARHTAGIRWKGQPAQEHRYWQTMAEPFVRRGTDGIPDRMDRLSGLGNAIVPQMAHLLGLAIINKMEQ